MRQNQMPVLWDLPVLKYLFFDSSFSCSLLGLLFAYTLALKIPFSWLPACITALRSSVISDGEEMSDTLQFQPWKDFQFNTNKPKHQQKSEAIFQMLLIVTGCLTHRAQCCSQHSRKKIRGASIMWYTSSRFCEVCWEPQFGFATSLA